MAKRVDPNNLPYKPRLSISNEKIDSLFSLINQMDTQQIKQFSMIHNVPLNVSDINGENLIHKVISIENILKKEFHRLNIIKFLVQNDVNPDKPNRQRIVLGRFHGNRNRIKRLAFRTKSGKSQCRGSN
jgi:hypothetical protein